MASNDKENNEEGVVSNVAIYSLMAKLGKLETETQTLKENVEKLEKEKSTLSLLNTEARYFVCLLTFASFHAWNCFRLYCSKVTHSNLELSPRGKQTAIKSSERFLLSAGYYTFLKVENQNLFLKLSCHFLNFASKRNVAQKKGSFKK